MILHGVDTEGYHRYANAHDLVVLADRHGAERDGRGHPRRHRRGFQRLHRILGGRIGIFGAGCATNALDVNRAVQSSTAAALRAIQVINKTARAEA